MKTTLLLLTAFQTFALTSAKAEQRPDFIPPTPPVSKPITNYTVADVMGIIATEPRQLPADHPYIVNKEYSKAIKKNWPGAKVSTNIDAMMQIVLNAPPLLDIESPLKRQISGAWGNVEIFIYNIMDIPDNEKVDAILRTVNAQTDAYLKKRAINFAVSQFGNFFDPRLIALSLPDLDNATVYTSPYRIIETRPPETYEIRRVVKENIVSALSDVFDFDETPFEVADEAAACAALKAWWEHNLQLITQKCAEKKADPKWTRQSFFGKPWDLKW